MKVLCSTGALLGKPNGRDYRLLERLSKELNCDGFEFMMYNDWYEGMEEMLVYLKQLKLYIPVVHCEKSIGRCFGIGTEEELVRGFKMFEKDCHLAKKLSAEKLVLHLWGGMVSDSNFESNLTSYEKLAAIAQEYELELMIENVVCNVKEPMTRWCQLVERYPEVSLIFDTKMAAFHGQLELLYTKEYEWLWKDGYIRHYHVSDYGGGLMDWANLRSLPIGKGNINFDAFGDFLRKTGYKGMITVETTGFDSEGNIDVEMLNECIEKVRFDVEKDLYK